MAEKLISWNVNGIRAVFKKGFVDWVKAENPDMLFLQEVKAERDQMPSELEELGYHIYWNSAQKKGYSGCAAFVKEKPLDVTILGTKDFDNEGRVQVLHYPLYSILNCYFPNSQELGKRLDYKLAFCDALLNYCNKQVKENKNIIICGDYNIAHTEIDLANPKSNEKNPGFLPEERAWMDVFVSHGYKDTFRHFNKEPGHYTWWSYRTLARERDVGWRIDYFCVNGDFIKSVKTAGILKEVLGSDHCPVYITL